MITMLIFTFLTLATVVILGVLDVFFELFKIFFKFAYKIAIGIGYIIGFLLFVIGIIIIL